MNSPSYFGGKYANVIYTTTTHNSNIITFDSIFQNDTILPIIQDQKWLVMENLSPDTVFEAAIRVKVKQMELYNSVWSRWSMPPLRWRTDPEGKVHNRRLGSSLENMLR